MPRFCAKGDSSPLHAVFGRDDVYLLPHRLICPRDDAWIMSFYPLDLDDDLVCTPLFHVVARAVERSAGGVAIQCVVRRDSHPLGAAFVRARETHTLLEFAEMLVDLCPLLP